MIEGADEWAVFTDPDVFGEPVTYTGAGQAPVSVTAIFTAAQSVAGGGAGPGISNTEPVLTFFADQLGFDPAADDLVTLTRSHPGYPAGTVLSVTELQPDGSGLVRAILERA